MKFIKLTPWDPSHQAYHINFEVVRYFCCMGAGDRAYTMVVFPEEVSLPVKETPEQILALLSQPTAV